MLSLYRTALSARRRTFPIAASTVEWLDTGARDVIAFRRGRSVCVVAAGDKSFELPATWGAVEVCSAELRGRTLPADGAAWLVGWTP